MAVKRTDYSQIATEAARSVMLELCRILGEYREEMAIVGGWVPELLFAQAAPPHVGSIDVDIALDHRLIDGDVYRTIRENLEEAGYSQGTDPFTFTRTVSVGGENVTVDVDFLSNEYGGTGRNRRHQKVQEIRARKARGCDLVFGMTVDVRIEGQLPNGAIDSVVVKVAGVVPFLVMKSMALGNRLKQKDAWDICFCLEHHPGGTQTLAELFAPHKAHGLVREALSILSDKFATIDQVGPQWVADFEELEPGDGRDLRVRQAYERVDDLLRRLAIRE